MAGSGNSGTTPTFELGPETLAILSKLTTGTGSGGTGRDGESAYQIAKRLDPTIGTEAEWIASLEDDDDHRWISGFGAPTQDMEVGTFYLDVSTGEVYEFTED